MALFENQPDDVLYFSMNDINEPMSRNSADAFLLDNRTWLTVEHYYQAMKFDTSEYQQKILAAVDSDTARKLGNAKFKRKRADFKKIRNTLMTRAIYTQAKTHSEIKHRILETGDRKLVENSQFDYYWGCGRDHRGDNNYGKILMGVRDKLNSEEQSSS